MRYWAAVAIVLSCLSPGHLWATQLLDDPHRNQAILALKELYSRFGAKANEAYPDRDPDYSLMKLIDDREEDNKAPTTDLIQRMSQEPDQTWLISHFIDRLEGKVLRSLSDSKRDLDAVEKFSSRIRFEYPGSTKFSNCSKDEVDNISCFTCPEHLIWRLGLIKEVYDTLKTCGLEVPQPIHFLYFSKNDLDNLNRLCAHVNRGAFLKSLLE